MLSSEVTTTLSVYYHFSFPGCKPFLNKRKTKYIKWNKIQNILNILNFFEMLMNQVVMESEENKTVSYGRRKI